MEFKRQKNILELCRAMGNQKIKVVAGLRQVGKSYLLNQLFKNELINYHNIDNKDIESIDLLKDYSSIRSSQALDKLLAKIIKNQSIKVLFIDEAQLAGDGYADVIINFHLHYTNIDIYVTGSNSHALSNDIIKQFKEYCSIISVKPLSYNEIISDEPHYSFSDYLYYGGIPRVVLKQSPIEKENELMSLFNEIYFSDLIERKEFKLLSERHLKMIMNWIYSNTNTINIINVTKAITKKSGIDAKTFSNYAKEVGDFIEWCHNAYLLYPLYEECSQSEIKKFNQIERKEYSLDNGLMNVNAGALHIEENLLENMIFIELHALFNKLYSKTISNEDRKIDFTCLKNNTVYNIQVVHTLTQNNMDREIGNLITLQDESKKLVIFLKNTLEEKDLPTNILFYKANDFIKNIENIII